MRRYWQPAALVDELAGNRPVKPVRLLGENLVLFRDDKGRYGLIGAPCPHRGTDLAYRPAGGRRPALRLPRLAVRRHRPMPGDAGRAGRQPHVRQHPAEGLSGGGEERHPVRLHGAGRAAGVSAFRLLRRAGSHTFAFKGMIDCNWLQSLEVGIDPAHTSFLHRFFHDEDPATATASCSATSRSIPTCR